MFKKVNFNIEGTESIFEGITNGQRWNGFHCPYFDVKNAKIILETLQDIEDAKKWGYSFYVLDELNNLLIEHTEDGKEVHFPIIFEGELYFPIGFCNWVWQEAIEEETED